MPPRNVVAHDFIGGLLRTEFIGGHCVEPTGAFSSRSDVAITVMRGDLVGVKRLVRMRGIVWLIQRVKLAIAFSDPQEDNRAL